MIGCSSRRGSSFSASCCPASTRSSKTHVLLNISPLSIFLLLHGIGLAKPLGFAALLRRTSYSIGRKSGEKVPADQKPFCRRRRSARHPLQPGRPRPLLFDHVLDTPLQLFQVETAFVAGDAAHGSVDV